MARLGALGVSSGASYLAPDEGGSTTRMAGRWVFYSNVCAPDATDGILLLEVGREFEEVWPVGSALQGS